jgi:hypothetical protein
MLVEHLVLLQSICLLLSYDANNSFKLPMIWSCRNITISCPHLLGHSPGRSSYRSRGPCLD